MQFAFLVEVNGFEPMTSCVQVRRSPSWATPPDQSDDRSQMTDDRIGSSLRLFYSEARSASLL